MQSFSRVVAAVAALSVSVVAPNAARAQALPPAATIIAKYVNAIGGKAEIMKVTSYKQSATMDIPAVGLSATMEIYAAAPNKMSSKMSLPGMGEVEQGFNGTVGWQVNPMQGPRVLADKELAIAKDGSDFYANMLYSADRYSTMETVGDTTINGEKAYKVKLVSKATGNESASFFSQTSGLLMGGVTTTESPMGSVTSTQIVSDYKKFGGVMMPTKMVTTVGPQQLVLTIKDVTLNGVPDSAFDIPAQIKPLIKP